MKSKSKNNVIATDSIPKNLTDLQIPSLPTHMVKKATTQYNVFCFHHT